MRWTHDGDRPKAQLEDPLVVLKGTRQTLTDLVRVLPRELEPIAEERHQRFHGGHLVREPEPQLAEDGQPGPNYGDQRNRQHGPHLITASYTRTKRIFRPRMVLMVVANSERRFDHAEDCGKTDSTTCQSTPLEPFFERARTQLTSLA